jgi:hypothetical protein
MGRCNPADCNHHVSFRRSHFLCKRTRSSEGRRRVGIPERNSRLVLAMFPGSDALLSSHHHSSAGSAWLLNIAQEEWGRLGFMVTSQSRLLSRVRRSRSVHDTQTCGISEVALMCIVMSRTAVIVGIVFESFGNLIPNPKGCTHPGLTDHSIIDLLCELRTASSTQSTAYNSACLKSVQRGRFKCNCCGYHWLSRLSLCST